jgi:hypothetical protein
MVQVAVVDAVVVSDDFAVCTARFSIFGAPESAITSALVSVFSASLLCRLLRHHVSSHANRIGKQALVCPSAAPPKLTPGSFLT